MKSPESFSPPPAALFAAIGSLELDLRPSRPPDLEAENRGLVELAQAFAKSRETILQKLADVVLIACKAHSAGVSLIEHDGSEQVLRWRAVAGELKGHLDTALPRTCNPGGTPLSIEVTQLISRPVRYGPMQGLLPEIEEALLVPLRLNGKLLGCVWVVDHDGTRRFDAE